MSDVCLCATVFELVRLGQCFIIVPSISVFFALYKDNVRLDYKELDLIIINATEYKLTKWIINLQTSKISKFAQN